MTEVIIQLLTEIAGRPAVSVDEPMSKHTSFKIGGKADVMIQPSDAKMLAAILKLLKDTDTPYFVMGNGSNLLVGDKGIRGAVIKIGDNMSSCEVSNNRITAQSGIKLSRLGKTAANNGLAGAEFASGIPGTLGGAVYMNAGAYGGEMKDIITDITYISGTDCTIHTIPAKECDFSYRHSIFCENDCIVTGATAMLKPDSSEEIKKRMSELTARRIEKQPLDKPSAGSTFKRPEGYFAGALIQEAGLKGLSVGGAEVSTKHSGFVVNNGGATADDVRRLIALVQEKVMKKFGVSLEPEVKLVGEF